MNRSRERELGGTAAYKRLLQYRHIPKHVANVCLFFHLLCFSKIGTPGGLSAAIQQSGPAPQLLDQSPASGPESDAVQDVAANNHAPIAPGPYPSPFSDLTVFSPANSVLSPGRQDDPAAALGKRKDSHDALYTPASGNGTGKKRRFGHPIAPRPSLDSDVGDLGEQDAEGEVGSGVGWKHWTDEEKDELFRWMLGDDERWAAFRTKMNNVFRDGAKHVFEDRKTYTALKSCFHRNLEVFKQIYSFESFLLSPDRPLSPEPGLQVLHGRPDEPARATIVERRLAAARDAGVPVGNLSLKMLDHWFRMGWYELFKNRYRLDPKTSHPVPISGGPSATPVLFAPNGTPPASEQAPSLPSDMIDPRLISVSSRNDASASTSAVDPRPPNERPEGVHLQGLPRLPSGEISAFARTPSRSMPPPRTPAVSSGPGRMQHLIGTSRTGPSPVHGPHHTKPTDAQPQLPDRLITIAQTLQTACTELTHAVRELTATVNVAREEAAARNVAHAQGKEQEGFSTQQRVQLAMELLAKDGVGDVVRTAAAEYLKKMQPFKPEELLLDG
ncbi:hypothetical protein CERSUDRAFT_125796 [Gelatoporia subvermispora B]|uniref:Uncharacterized protein n=1 Tax=Ceriporiopsis subvermispora (strain B) TaxID=914234 RepID=M2PE15_CERS8|nr:hypothetical protein CERSUDRAFT_125796 [Gelatoporia subvermispora B]